MFDIGVMDPKPSASEFLGRIRIRYCQKLEKLLFSESLKFIIYFGQENILLPVDPDWNQKNVFFFTEINHFRLIFAQLSVTKYSLPVQCCIPPDHIAAQDTKICLLWFITYYITQVFKCSINVSNGHNFSNYTQVFEFEFKRFLNYRTSYKSNMKLTLENLFQMLIMFDFWL